MEEIIKRYFENLEKGDYENLMELFSEGAVVNSPLYGKRLAKDFYKELIDDSQDSKIDLLNIFISKNNGAGHFRYDWTLKNGSNSSFEGVDIFEFNTEGKIIMVTIIYDTYKTRENFQEMKK